MPADLEKDLETRCRKYAKSKGCELRKVYPIEKGRFDRQLYCPGGVMVHMEFKRKKGSARAKLQEREQEWLRSMGFSALFVHSFGFFKLILDGCLQDGK